jgi:hypothetical protein
VATKVSVEQVVSALRTVRPGVYQVDGGTPGPTVTLLLNVSTAGRRNAASRIERALANGGLRLAADDPIGALTDGGAVPVRHAG